MNVNDIIETAADEELSFKLENDLKKAARALTKPEVKVLISLYYSVQKTRIVTGNQIAALTKSGEPHEVIGWVFERFFRLEKAIKGALEEFSKHDPGCQWARSITGIGPVLACGLSAHIDIGEAPTVGHIWSFCGYNPEVEWKKGEKRPWNATLKTICWKIGESFVKVKGLESDVYGKVYEARKVQEIQRNEEGKFAGQAEAKLEKHKIGKSTEAYKAYSKGKLPPAHIHARSTRYAVKLFLAHWHHTEYVRTYKKDPPLPYAIAIGGHAHHILPPEI